MREILRYRGVSSAAGFSTRAGEEGFEHLHFGLDPLLSIMA